MFDTHVHRARHWSDSQPEQQTVTITEHRAPTDASVSLLREMEQKAKDSIFAAIRCNDNPIKFSAIAFSDNFHLTEKVRIKFTLGDIPYEVVTEIPRGERGGNLMVLIRDQIAKQIANHLVISIGPQHLLKGSIL